MTASEVPLINLPKSRRLGTRLINKVFLCFFSEQYKCRCQLISRLCVSLTQTDLYTSQTRVKSSNHTKCNITQAHDTDQVNTSPTNVTRHAVICLGDRCAFDSWYWPLCDWTIRVKIFLGFEITIFFTQMHKCVCTRTHIACMHILRSILWMQACLYRSRCTGMYTPPSPTPPTHTHSAICSNISTLCHSLQHFCKLLLFFFKGQNSTSDKSSNMANSANHTEAAWSVCIFPKVKTKNIYLQITCGFFLLLFALVYAGLHYV